MSCEQIYLRCTCVPTLKNLIVEDIKFFGGALQDCSGSTCGPRSRGLGITALYICVFALVTSKTCKYYRRRTVLANEQQLILPPPQVFFNNLYVKLDSKELFVDVK